MLNKICVVGYVCRVRFLSFPFFCIFFSIFLCGFCTFTLFVPIARMSTSTILFFSAFLQYSFLCFLHARVTELYLATSKIGLL